MKTNRIEDFIIESAKRMLPVKKIILFGSRARGTAKERSDYDFAFKLEPTSDKSRKWVLFCGFVDEQAPTLLNIDTVDLSSSLPLELREEIEQEGRVIYSNEEEG